jgi:hypothetical protein
MKKILFLGLFLLVTCNAYAASQPMGAINVRGNAAFAKDISLDGHLTAAGQIWSDGSLATTESGWVDYGDISTIVGFSAFTSKKIKYKKIGGMAVVFIFINGTSNGTSLTFTVPNEIKSESVSGVSFYCTGFSLDNGSGTADNGFAYIATNSTTVLCFPTGSTSTNWTNANGKMFGAVLIYPLN